MAVLVFSSSLTGCLEESCEVRTALDTSLGPTDEFVLVHAKKTPSGAWQVKAVVYCYQGSEALCSEMGQESVRMFITQVKVSVGDLIDETADHYFRDLQKGDELHFTIDEDGIVRDSEGEVYQFY